MMRTGVLYGGEAETFGFGRTECAAFTGYRPAKFLAAFPQGDARQRVGELLRPVVAGLYDLGVRLFLSGMAEGFDLWAAAEVLALRDRGRCPDAAVAAVIPFRGQERGYAPASLDEYRFICARAVAVRCSPTAIIRSVSTAATIFWSITPRWWWATTTGRGAEPPIPSGGRTAAGCRSSISAPENLLCSILDGRSSLSLLY